MANLQKLIDLEGLSYFLGQIKAKFVRSVNNIKPDSNGNINIANMTGATYNSSGRAGLVPAPAAGSNTRYLRSDGSWAAIVAMSGASATVNGSAGLVPAPVAGSSIRYLCADGTWKEVDLDSAKTKLVKYS